MNDTITTDNVYVCPHNVFLCTSYTPVFISFFSSMSSIIYHIFTDCLFVCLMVFNGTFNNISVISWWSVLLVE